MKLLSAVIKMGYLSSSVESKGKYLKSEQQLNNSLQILFMHMVFVGFSTYPIESDNPSGSQC